MKQSHFVSLTLTALYLLVAVPVFCQQSGYLAKFIDNNGHLGNSVVFQSGNLVAIGTTVPGGGFPLTVQNGIYVNGGLVGLLARGSLVPIMAVSNGSYAMYAENATGWGVVGNATSTGVSREFGVAGFAANFPGTGVYGQRIAGSSLATQFENQAGVWGDSADGTGVNATSDTGIALWATNNTDLPAANFIDFFNNPNSSVFAAGGQG